MRYRGLGTIALTAAALPAGCGADEADQKPARSSPVTSLEGRATRPTLDGQGRALISTQHAPDPFGGRWPPSFLVAPAASVQHQARAV
jgi:hypothetical protein